MRNDCQHKGVGGILIGWTMVILCAGLLVSTVWDADGNPNTDNLPQIVLPTEVGTASDADARIEDSDKSSSHHRPRFFSWLRQHTDVVREWRWWSLAVPRRGP